MAPPVLIKKYGNRRLYDTQDSRYITLEELADKVRRGSDVRVVDASSNDDLTQATLAQIILESGTAARVLPVGLLTQLVRLGDDALAEFFSMYVTNALDFYLSAKRRVRGSNYGSLATLPLNAAEAMGRMFMSPFSQDTAPPPSAAPPPRRDDRDDDVASLRREIEELKRSMRPEGASVGKPGAKRRQRRGTP
ncbi:MAG TPA: polyhydroxyalkanoate synthesis regulator DNA-binding domain-containing protein [Kofleriaceae bacterium]|nr:polyhydroxyalkanoate synthesis regulator DNA-binding domain-containing protein [Kofleriaceae bacterium]